MAVASISLLFLVKKFNAGKWSSGKHIKEAASQVISEHGAAISHHHGVGMDHLPWIEA